MRSCRMHKFTEHTETDIDVIREDIALSAKRGYAYTANQFELGVGGLAIPIADINGSQAALSTTASLIHFKKEGVLEDTIDMLRRAALSLRG